MDKITFIKRDTSDREGNALKTKDGRPYTRLSLKVESKGDRYISGFGNKDNENWKIGDEVDIVITESTTKDKNGVPYLNFSMSKKEDVTNEKLELILNALTGIRLELQSIKAFVEPRKRSQQEIDEGINLDDVPF